MGEDKASGTLTRHMIRENASVNTSLNTIQRNYEKYYAYPKIGGGINDIGLMAGEGLDFRETSGILLSIFRFVLVVGGALLFSS